MRLLEVEREGPAGAGALVVAGADLMDGTPIFDIKPYLPYTDSHPEALAGFTGAPGGGASGGGVSPDPAGAGA